MPLRITAVFWVIKLLSTAMGESLSDALVHGINQYFAVTLGFLAFAGAMALQLRSPRYNPWKYWFAVAMVAVFGTMAADVLHIGLHIPYLVSSLFYLVCLTVIFLLWHRVEGSLSIHSISTRRREFFYWLAVLATFALGTAVGDLTAVTFHLGYLGSAILFCVLFALPGLAYAATRSHDVLWFWTAYILTRPLGAVLRRLVWLPAFPGRSRVRSCALRGHLRGTDRHPRRPRRLQPHRQPAVDRICAAGSSPTHVDHEGSHHWMKRGASEITTPVCEPPRGVSHVDKHRRGTEDLCKPQDPMGISTTCDQNNLGSTTQARRVVKMSPSSLPDGCRPSSTNHS